MYARHGHSRHPLYATWADMRRRCNDPSCKDYPHYGGRGITVCARWDSVADFVADMERLLGPRPEGMVLGRIDHDGDYEPGNVRWATRAEQRRNRRTIARPKRATGHLKIIEGAKGPVWYLKTRVPGRGPEQTTRRLAPAYLGNGKPPAGSLTERQAQAALADFLASARPK